MDSDDRPTLSPGFDVEQFARESDEKIRRANAVAAPAEAPRVESDDRLSDEDLEEVYRARIGDEGQRVVCVRTPEELLHVARGSVEGFVLSRVDGRRSVGALLGACELPRLDALSALCELLDAGIVELRGPNVG